jgi:Lar family restriction alleviation protein
VVTSSTLSAFLKSEPMSDDRFLPCPFCGSSDIYVSEDDTGRARWVSCNICQCDGPLVPQINLDNATLRKKVIAAWNQRDARNETA